LNQKVLNTEMIIRKRTEGKILYNDGEFAEVQLVGIEGNDDDLLLETTQIHRCDTDDLPQEFQRRFPVGRWLDVLTTTEISFHPPTDRGLDEQDGEKSEVSESIQ